MRAGILTEFGEDFPRARDDGLRQAGQAGDLDAVGPVRPAGPHLVEEDDLVVPFLDRDVEVANAREPIGERGELVVVRGEEHLRASAAVVELLGHGPGDGEPVEGRGAAPDFIK